MNDEVQKPFLTQNCDPRWKLRKRNATLITAQIVILRQIVFRAWSFAGRHTVAWTPLRALWGTLDARAFWAGYLLRKAVRDGFLSNFSLFRFIVFVVIISLFRFASSPTRRDLCKRVRGPPSAEQTTSQSLLHGIGSASMATSDNLHRIFVFVFYFSLVFPFSLSRGPLALRWWARRRAGKHRRRTWAAPTAWARTPATCTAEKWRPGWASNPVSRPSRACREASPRPLADSQLVRALPRPFVRYPDRSK